MKKTIILFWTFLFCSTIYAYDFESNGIYYNKIQGGCEVTYEKENVASYSGTITIPSTANGYKVISIAYNAFRACTDLESITIPESVTDIAQCSFMNCTNLQEIRLPSKLNKIKSALFWGCKNLKNIDIPKNVTIIESCAFYMCSSLEEITIPNKVTKLGQGAFQRCSNLKKIEIPSSVKEAESGVFSECTNLESVTIHSGLQTIEHDMFYDCTGLKSITIPESVTTIKFDDGEGFPAFYKCNNLKEIKIVNSNKMYYSDHGIVYNKKKTTLYYCPEGFEGSYTILPSCNSLSGRSFYSCTKLTDIKLSSKISSIPYSCFYNCTSLRNMILHEGIKTINTNAFSSCGIYNIELPSTLQNINSRAFDYCIYLKSIYTNASNPASCINDAFSNLNYDNCVLFVPSKTKSKYMAANGWNSIKYINDGSEPIYMNKVQVHSPVTTMNAGDEVKLTYSYTPEKATDQEVVWSSIDENVAEISQDGIVKGKNIGLASIVCRPKNGGGKSSTTYIVVSGLFISNLSLPQSTIYMSNGETYKLNVKITPSDATYKVLEYTSSDPNIAIVADDGTIYGQKPGACIITIKSKDGSNCSTQAIIIVSESTGIDNPYIKNNIQETYKYIQNRKIIIKRKDKTYKITGQPIK